MKTINFLKSGSDKCRRKIVIAEIIKLRNLAESDVRHQRIVREVGKLHSFWFKGPAKDIRISELQGNWLRDQPNFMQPFL
jgi:hypothetical protein